MKIKLKDRPANGDRERVFVWFPIATVDNYFIWLTFATRVWFEDGSANWGGDGSGWRYYAKPPQGKDS